MFRKQIESTYTDHTAAAAEMAAHLKAAADSLGPNPTTVSAHTEPVNGPCPHCGKQYTSGWKLTTVWEPSNKPE